MDSARNTSRVNDGQVMEMEKIQGNCQTIRDAGQKDEMDDNNGPKSLIMEIYPWIMQFKKMCRSSLSQRSMNSLKHLMMFFSRNVRPSVNECHTKPLRAEKLKDCISETLLFFLYYYREINNDKDRDAYLILMSDLLAMYIDMELKASKKCKEHCSKISARLTSCLHVYLEHSAEYLLDTLLKVHFMTQNYQEIMDPVITKIFKGIEEHPSSSMMYVRYLLAYRLWKKLNKDMAVRNQINMIAITSLGAMPDDFPSFILESVLPKVPKTQKLSTKLLLVQKFEVEKSCEEFLKFCTKERGLKFPKTEDESRLTCVIPTSVPEDHNEQRELIINNNVSNVFLNQVNSSLGDSAMKKLSHEKNLVNSTVSSVVTKSLIPVKSSPLRKSKKSNDIVLIDLTCDGVTEKVIKKKKTRRKLNWLEEAKKRINPKINVKKDLSIEDEAGIILQPEDSLELDCVRIESPKSQTSIMEINIEEVQAKNQDNTRDERVVGQDSLPAISSETKTTIDDTISTTITNVLTSSKVEWNKLENQENERNHVKETTIEKNEAKVVPGVTQVASFQVETCKFPIHNSTFDQYTRVTRVDGEEMEEATRGNIVTVVDTSEALYEVGKALKDKTLVGHTERLHPVIKAEHMSDQPNEIINEELISSEGIAVNVVEYASEVTLQTTCQDEDVKTSKISEAEFQENIDGLSLLASVSQSVSPLTMSPKPINELIKVKNYASLANLNGIVEADTSNDALPFSSNLTSQVINRMVDIYPEDAMDKVAYQVEVTSTEEIESRDNCDQINALVPFSNIDDIGFNSQTQSSNIVPVIESTTQAEKDDTNVILNGETVVLFQKSPNSNLYIINKAVENRDHIDEVANPHREMSDRINETGPFSYDIYDNIYQNQASSYDISQYNRDLSGQESRRGIKIKVDSTGETIKGCGALEMAKVGKKKTLNVEKTRIKRKGASNSPGLTRQRHIKQEYNHMKSNYGIQDCPKEHVDPTRSIHIPVTHASPLTSIYTKYTGGPELYLPCHKNCNSMSCGLCVNPPTSLHSHCGKNSSTGNSHCSCLNCAYEIVTHCGECIIPNGETRMTTIDPNSYYLPLHSAVQNTTTQDCNRTNIDDSLSKMYDNQLVCKLEQTTMVSNGGKLDNVKCEPNEIYRAELDNKLPLKKRFKAMMSVSFDEMPIKREKYSESYPGTPMLSIAALEAAAHNNTTTNSLSSCEKNSLNVESKFARNDNSHNAREMIRRDYGKDMIMSPPPAPYASSSQPNGYHGNGVERKRKSRLPPDSVQNNVEATRPEGSCEKMGKTTNIIHKHRDTIIVTAGGVGTKRTTKTQVRPLEKVKEPELAKMKNSTRQTRSSKRNVPKVNYIYTDGDSDCNPSGAAGSVGGTRRKRKKINR